MPVGSRLLHSFVIGTYFTVNWNSYPHGIYTFLIISFSRRTFQAFYLSVYTIYTYFVFGTRVEPSSLLLRPLIGLLYQPRMIDGDAYGAVGGMNEWPKEWNTRRKPAAVPFCPQIPHCLTRARSRPPEVGNRRLTVWATARPTFPHSSPAVERVSLPIIGNISWPFVCFPLRRPPWRLVIISCIVYDFHRDSDVQCQKKKWSFRPNRFHISENYMTLSLLSVWRAVS
jgi:hypothetical protein